jgi:ubiquinone/menaquinone biosynthesis C-methylase UbiE
MPNIPANCPIDCIHYVKLFNDVAKDFSCVINKGARILDFGCGNGALVEAYQREGFDAYGTDIILEEETDFLRKIDSSGRIPFPDSFFDLVVSFQVFEHVVNYADALSEIRRVMKTGALSIHTFPSQLRPLEVHTHIPFGGIVKNYNWMLVWAFFGIRNHLQNAMNMQEVATWNYRFLKKNTNYMSKRKIIKYISKYFNCYFFAEREWIRNSFTWVKHFYPLVSVFPFLTKLYSTFNGRTIVLIKDIPE